MPLLSRRLFLTMSAASGGGLTLGFSFADDSGGADRSFSAPELTAWIVIHPDDTVVIRVARSEMGQGSLTALSMLVAEELECDWARVRPEFVAPEENLRRGRVWRDMGTAASRSVSASQEYLREAGATAREMLVAAAAAEWCVPVAECQAAESVITHRPTNRSVSFGAVAAKAASMPPPSHVTLKPPQNWKLIGSRQRQFGAVAKIVGEPVYGADVRLPGMLHAAIRHCPTFGARLHSVATADVLARAGVRHVIKLDDAVAVVAPTWWQAKTALDALPIEWTAGNTALTDSEIASTLRQALMSGDVEIGRADGDVGEALAHAAHRVEAAYAAPFLAHATMEPQNCTAHVTSDRVDVWAPTQDGEATLAVAAAAAGVPQSRVIVHMMLLGGGFGRRSATQDFVRQAVLIAKEVGQPVKLLWSREEDIRHDFYRPAAMARQIAALDAAGAPVAWSVKIAAPSILESLAPGTAMGGFDRQALQGFLDDMPYAVPNYSAAYAACVTPVPLGLWRSVNHSQNAFFKESFVDEMAHAAGQDPYRFRGRLLAQAPRLLAVLDAAAERAKWDTPPPVGIGRGIAAHAACGSFCAQVVEVSVDALGRLRTHRVVSAIDCGHVVNPQSVEAQTEGAIVYGLSAALYGEITIKNGGVEQSNFHDYQMLRMADMPEIETVIVPSGGFWGGVGEPPLPPLAPALCNAIFAATGTRIRSLPIKAHDLRSRR